MSPRQARLAVDIFTGAVIASVGVALAGLVWRIAGDGGNAALAPAGAVAPAAAAPDVQPIIALAPFGRAAIDASTAPQTSLPLQLKAVLMAVPASASTALIASGSDKAQSYGIGASVGGATVAAIGVDHVVLDVGGRRELLSFPRIAATATAAAPAAAVTPQIAPPPPPPVPSPSDIAAVGEAVAGQGFRIGGDPPPALVAAGVQAGDIIERVNGIDVGDPARAREMLGQAALAGGARVDVMRNGRRFTVAISR